MAVLLIVQMQSSPLSVFDYAQSTLILFLCICCSSLLLSTMQKDVRRLVLACSVEKAAIWFA
jgi:hypothetical protein